MDPEAMRRVFDRQTIAFEKHTQAASGAANKVLNDLKLRNKVLYRKRDKFQRRLDSMQGKGKKKKVQKKKAAVEEELAEVDREFDLTRQQQKQGWKGPPTVTATLVTVCKKMDKLAKQTPTSTEELNKNISAFAALMDDLQRTVSVFHEEDLVGEVFPLAIEELGTLLSTALADIVSLKAKVTEHGEMLEAHSKKFVENDRKLAAHDTKLDEQLAQIAALQAQQDKQRKEMNALRDENSRFLDIATDNRGDISALAFGSGSSILRESMNTVVQGFQAPTSHSCSPPRSPPFNASASCSPVRPSTGSLPQTICVDDDYLDLSMCDLQINNMSAMSAMSVPLTPPERRLQNPLAPIDINRNRNADSAYAAKAPSKCPSLLPNSSFSPNEKYKK
mmetsp:Transcript_3181/g.5958  ORF Transcript_3181/g.5958 Transcript_3181/m.5958 type:complete len:391 (-) Transcript_3181:45-1217(-)|eukprot:CAMPEP_0182518172 /NCGR_PEP_ID=MMETSP1321-20130603/43703_1 /TAXON_ID=91990 /ORGANISM="Bolidomonas sp., Strain RCC1657" /LENGTH=390 /DNA_ID=CAMNT_0024726017 /DNA_START=926 /DNA_END=2098 /DNA_ORIENTATION=+